MIDAILNIYAYNMSYTTHIHIFGTRIIWTNRIISYTIINRNIINTNNISFIISTVPQIHADQILTVITNKKHNIREFHLNFPLLSVTDVFTFTFPAPTPFHFRVVCRQFNPFMNALSDPAVNSPCLWQNGIVFLLFFVLLVIVKPPHTPSKCSTCNANIQVQIYT